MNLTKWLVGAVIVGAILGIGFGIGVWFARGAKTPMILARPKPPPSPIMFVGKVIDQDGEPIENAVITCQRSELVRTQAGDAVGSVVPDRLPKNRFSVVSARSGLFYIMLPPPNNELEILAIKKDGYEWIIDLAWTLGSRWDDDQNREFNWKGKFWYCPLYETVPGNPAIYPMHQIGNPKPATRPSRGGRDLLCNKKTRVNHPMPLQVPSAGPNAPRTQKEMERKLAEFLESKGLPQPSLHQTTKP